MSSTIIAHTVPTLEQFSVIPKPYQRDAKLFRFSVKWDSGGVPSASITPFPASRFRADISQGPGSVVEQER